MVWLGGALPRLLLLRGAAVPGWAGLGALRETPFPGHYFQRLPAASACCCTCRAYAARGPLKDGTWALFRAASAAGNDCVWNVPLPTTARLQNRPAVRHYTSLRCWTDAFAGGSIRALARLRRATCAARSRARLRHCRAAAALHTAHTLRTAAAAAHRTHVRTHTTLRARISTHCLYLRAYAYRTFSRIYRGCCRSSFFIGASAACLHLAYHLAAFSYIRGFLVVRLRLPRLFIPAVTAFGCSLHYYLHAAPYVAGVFCLLAFCGAVNVYRCYRYLVVYALRLPLPYCQRRSAVCGRARSGYAITAQPHPYIYGRCVLLRYIPRLFFPLVYLPYTTLPSRFAPRLLLPECARFMFASFGSSSNA